MARKRKKSTSSHLLLRKNMASRTTKQPTSGITGRRRSDPPHGWEWNQSQLQAFYLLQNVTISGVPIESDDWVGAFSPRGVLVGARQWDTSICLNGVCDVPVMGQQGEDPMGMTSGYMLPGEIPTFEIYDTSENMFYPAWPSENIPWYNGSYILPGNLEGGLATIEYNLHYGANLISIPLDLDTCWECSSVTNVFDDIEDYITWVQTLGLAAYYVEQGAGNLWVGGLTTIEPTAGYWIGMNDEASLSLTGTIVGNLTYSLQFGHSLISFPVPGGVSIECAFPDNIVNQIVGIVGDGAATMNIDGQWIGSLTELEYAKGYWITTTEDLSFQFNLDCSTIRTQTFQYMDLSLPEMGPDTNIKEVFQDIMHQVSGTPTPLPLPGGKMDRSRKINRRK